VRSSGHHAGSARAAHLCALSGPSARGAVVARRSGVVFMCGYPIALKLAAVTPIAAPSPAEWAAHRAVYRSD